MDGIFMIIVLSLGNLKISINAEKLNINKAISIKIQKNKLFRFKI